MREGYQLVRSGKVPPGQPAVHAVITAAAAINGGIRWKYTITLGQWNMKSSPASGGTWVPGKTGLFAFNSAEDMNTFTTGTGVIGTGNYDVAQSNGQISGGLCYLLPLPVGGYVIVIPRGRDSTVHPSVTYYTIINAQNSAQ